MTQGIFGNQAMGQLPRGIFANQAPDGGLGVTPPRLSRGVFGNRAPDSGSGLGEVGGIFNGPTALGTALGLSEQTAGNAECQLSCVRTSETDWDLERCRIKCDQEFPPQTTIEPEPGYTDGGNGGGASYDASAGQKCDSANIISMVQAAIGASIDGKWGPESQGKLKASGQPFKAFAPSCEGPVPSYSEPSGGGGGVTPGTTTPTTTPTTVPASQANMLGGIGEFFTSKFIGIPIYGWAAGFTILAALGITFARLQAEQAGE
jgi:hypothetical protein